MIREDGGARLVGVISAGTVDFSEEFPCGSLQTHARVDAVGGWLAEQIAAANPDTGDPSDTGGPSDTGAPVQAPGKTEDPGGCASGNTTQVRALGLLLAAWAARRRQGSRRGAVALFRARSPTLTPRTNSEE